MGCGPATEHRPEHPIVAQGRLAPPSANPPRHSVQNPGGFCWPACGTSPATRDRP
jgi:hypothetical protein